MTNDIRSLIGREVDWAYKATYGLIQMCEGLDLNWKPATGDNWMTTGQLLSHITIACGWCFKGFVDDDWCADERLPEVKEGSESPLPAAENLPSVESVSQAIELLQVDEKLSREMLAKADADDLANKMIMAPWGIEDALGNHLLSSVKHLESHKSQLFYYLKLQGKPVNTAHMWGMDTE